MLRFEFQITKQLRRRCSSGGGGGGGGGIATEESRQLAFLHPEAVYMLCSSPF
jgi:hypothetical protein